MISDKLYSFPEIHKVPKTASGRIRSGVAMTSMLAENRKTMKRVGERWRWSWYGLVFGDYLVVLSKQITPEVNGILWEYTKDKATQVSQIEEIIKDQMRS